MSTRKDVCTGYQSFLKELRGRNRSSLTKLIFWSLDYSIELIVSLKYRENQQDNKILTPGFPLGFSRLPVYKDGINFILFIMKDSLRV